MFESFYRILKPFIWPRYYEEGPPKYMDIVFFNKDFTDSDGKVKEPAKSVVDLIILGYRPVTSLSVLAALVENQNRPMYGAQIGYQLEQKFQLPKGWFTKTRYYDTRIGKLLKVFTRLSILEETKVKDWKTNKEYIGYRVREPLYPAIKERMLALLSGESLSLFTPLKETKTHQEVKPAKRCLHCNATITSLSAKYCGLCGMPLRMRCSNCGEEVSLEYSFCLSCGKRLD